MVFVRNLLIVLVFVCICVIVFVLKLLHKLWLKPIRIQTFMGKQGIRGPSYTFLHGSTKEMSNMKRESQRIPMGFSNDLFSRLQPHVKSWINIYGMNYLCWNGPTAEFVVTETELIKEIMNNKNDAYSKVKPEACAKKIIGDDVLVTSEGEKWAKSRKLANYALHGESLKKMIPEMIASVEVMLERWEHHQGKEIEVSEELMLLTSEVISRTAFGSSYIEGKSIFGMLKNMILITTRNAYKQRLPVISKFWKTIDEIEIERMLKGINEAVIGIIEKREEKIATGEVDNYGTDYLGLLVKEFHNADKNNKISMQNMIDECRTFYSAGQETVQTLLLWCVFLLASHTDWQEEARKEVLELFGNQNPNPDTIAKLKTIGMIINETLRLYPPASGIVRRVKREVRLGNLTLPADLHIYIPTLKLHTDPEIWGQDVHVFKPERFAEGVAKATNKNAAAFFPFGIGPRICVGMSFAVTEAKIVLSMILQRYAFTLSPAYIHSPIQFLAVCPQHGVQVLLHKL